MFETPNGAHLGSPMSARVAVSMLQDLDRELARLHAIQADLLVIAADVEAHVDEYFIGEDLTGERRQVLIEDPIRDELACALRRSSHVMQRMIDVSKRREPLQPASWPDPCAPPGRRCIRD